MSKLGYCSRSQATTLIVSGAVRVNGVLRLDPEWPVQVGRDQLEVHGNAVRAADKVYLALNKPRGLVTTASDEQGRQTVFACLEEHQSAHLSAVGRLDKASEGLLLFTNDSAWAAGIMDPSNHVQKIYHAQLDCVAEDQLLEQLRSGVTVEGEFLAVKAATRLRAGERHSWLELTLEEGKNRHIRRLVQALGVNVLRLIRIAIGPLQLGELPRGASRALTAAEVAALRH